MDSKKTAVSTNLAPEAIGPYSQAIAAGGLVFTSGQIPVDPENGGIVSGGIEKQTERSLKNIMAVLAEAGCTQSDVVKTTVFLSDMSHFSAMNEVYAQFFTQPFPARSCVEVSRLPKDVLVEIEAVALKAR